MTCNNCGTEVNDNDKFCNKCGKALKNNNDSSITSNNYLDEELMKAYVGKNYEKFLANKVNIYFLIFPAIYALYRKEYKYFLLFLLLPFIPVIGIIAYVISMILLSLSFNESYLKEAKDYIEFIKSSNPGASSEMLKDMASKKGGTNILGSTVYGAIVLILAILYVTAIVFLVVMFRKMMLYDYYGGGNETNENSSSWDDEIKKDNYDNGGDKGKILNLYYEVPFYYFKEYYNKDEKAKYNYKYDSNSYCSVEIGSEGITLEEYLNKIDTNRVEWKENSINDNVYKIITKVGEAEINYYYAINKDNITYTITFKDYNDVEEKCSSIRNELLDSIRYNLNETNEKTDIA